MEQWNKQNITELFDLPFLDLMFRAQTIHRENFPNNEIELAKILSIKTGGCPENCGYFTQRALSRLLNLNEISDIFESTSGG